MAISYLTHLSTLLYGKCSRLISQCVRAKSLQSCPTLCDPMDCSLPGSSVHGILQARILQWVVMPSSRGTSQPRDQTHISYVSCFGRWALPLEPPGKHLLFFGFMLFFFHSFSLFHSLTLYSIPLICLPLKNSFNFHSITII